jgi:hypothetical protein
MDTVSGSVFDDSLRRRSPLQNAGMIWMLLLACPPDVVVDSSVDSANTEVVAGVLVAITAPAYGYDLGVSTETVTLQGLAADRVDSLTWTVQGASNEDSGDIALGTEWTLEDVPLSVGDNVITVEASFEGTLETDSIVVTYYPDSPFTAGLRLSEGVVFVDETITLEAATQALPDQGTLTVGTNSAQPWGLLLETSPGWYSGTFELTPSELETLEVRAFSTDGSATPPVTLEVLDRLGEDQWEDALAAYEDIAMVWADEGDVEGALDAAGAVWAPITGGGYSFAIERLHFALVPPSERSRGGTTTIAPLYGSTLAATTVSSSGTAGPLPTDLSRAPDVRTDGRQSILLSPFSDAGGFGDETPGVQNLLQGASGCPFPAPMVNTTPQGVTVSAFWQSTQEPLVNLATHGALVATDLFTGTTRTSAMVWTREALTPATQGSHESRLRAGRLVYADPVLRAGTTTPPTPSLAVTADGVRTATLTSPMPRSIVVLSACFVGATPEMAAAWQSKGASSVSGYDNNVNGAFAQTRTTAFWAELIGGQASGYAVAVDPSDDGDATPAKLVHYGNPDTSIGIQLLNADFDGSDQVWVVDPEAQARIGYLSGEGSAYGLVTPTGKSFNGYVSPDAKTVAKATQSVCAPANETITVTLDWQVAMNPYLGWETSQDNSMFVRYGTGDAVLILNFADIKAAVDNPPSSGWAATGKETASFTLEGTGSPVELELIGYGYDAYRMDFVFDNLVAK